LILKKPIQQQFKLFFTFILQAEVPILKRECIGDASETALLKYVEMAVGGAASYQSRNKKIAEVPFNSTNKFQISIHSTEDPSDSAYLLVMKGAPERILDRCTTIFIRGEELELNEKIREKFNKAYLELGGMGERVLGLCDYRLSPDKYQPGE